MVGEGAFHIRYYLQYLVSMVLKVVVIYNGLSSFSLILLVQLMGSDVGIVDA